MKVEIVNKEIAEHLSFLAIVRIYEKNTRKNCLGLNCAIMTSSNGNIFRVTGLLCGEFTGPGEFPTQRPVTRSFYVFFDLRLNERLSKQPWGWWFETPSWSLWRQCNAQPMKRLNGMWYVLLNAEIEGELDKDPTMTAFRVEMTKLSWIRTRAYTPTNLNIA